MKAYAVGHLEQVSLGADIIQYLKKIDATLEPFGGKFLVHGDPIEVLEGQLGGDLIVIEFPDIESAREWYASAEYRKILPLRTANSTSTVFLVPGAPADHKATDLLSDINHFPQGADALA